MMEQHELDCALIVKPAYPLEGLLRWRSLRQEPFVLIVPPGEASSDVTWLLSNYPFVRYERRSHGCSLVERFLQRKKYAPKESVETDSIEACWWRAALASRFFHAHLRSRSSVRGCVRSTWGPTPSIARSD